MVPAGYGYVPNVAQTEHALLGIRMTASVFPAITFFIGVIALASTASAGNSTCRFRMNLQSGGRCSADAERSRGEQNLAGKHMKRITIEDVARRARVSKGTVSAVINAKDSVKAGTRDHILEIMKELNFRPKGMARNLKNGAQDKSIGFIIKDMNYPFYTSIAAGVKEYANSKGYSVIVASSDDDHTCEKRCRISFPQKTSRGRLSHQSSRERRKLSISSS